MLMGTPETGAAGAAAASASVGHGLMVVAGAAAGAPKTGMSGTKRPAAAASLGEKAKKAARQYEEAARWLTEEVPEVVAAFSDNLANVKGFTPEKLVPGPNWHHCNTTKTSLDVTTDQLNHLPLDQKKLFVWSDTNSKLTASFSVGHHRPVSVRGRSRGIHVHAQETDRLRRLGVEDHRQ